MYVDRCWSAAQFDQNPELQAAGKLINAEPYECEYKYDDKHICAWWANEFGVEFDPNVDLPSVYLADRGALAADAAAAQLGDAYALVQFSGGQPPEGFDPQSPYEPNIMRLQRNYPPPMANALMRRLRAAYPRIEWINFALPNEPDAFGARKINAPYITALELARRAKIVVCIDSCLAHFAAAAGKPAIVLWNSLAWARPNKYGWHIHRNLVAPNMEHDYADVLAAIGEINE